MILRGVPLHPSNCLLRSLPVPHRYLRTIPIQRNPTHPTTSDYRNSPRAFPPFELTSRFIAHVDLCRGTHEYGEGTRGCKQMCWEVGQVRYDRIGPD